MQIPGAERHKMSDVNGSGVGDPWEKLLGVIISTSVCVTVSIYESCHMNLQWIKLRKK